MNDHLNYGKGFKTEEKTLTDRRENRSNYDAEKSAWTAPRCTVIDAGLMTKGGNLFGLNETYIIPTTGGGTVRGHNS